jgi:hypothetical protein
VILLGITVSLQLTAVMWAISLPTYLDSFLFRPFLQEHDSWLCVLVSITHGLKKANGTLMLVINAKPFELMPAKTVKDLASNYPNKVSCQFPYTQGESDAALRLKQWSITKYQEWLDCPLIEDGGVLYDITTEIEKYKKLQRRYHLRGKRHLCLTRNGLDKNPFLPDSYAH